MDIGLDEFASPKFDERQPEKTNMCYSLPKQNWHTQFQFRLAVATYSSLCLSLAPFLFRSSRFATEVWWYILRNNIEVRRNGRSAEKQFRWIYTFSLSTNDNKRNRNKNEKNQIKTPNWIEPSRDTFSTQCKHSEWEWDIVFSSITLS